ncbi:putative p-loop containing nucleoside triphosphate hydrolase protein [Seiridium unicorne]|uniref:P-loop containing nucleoside triphosphate hydrolase protein n=1 Tax=Seiridium unicorne TaxID=138068 RepID=A0ABR2UZ30_9PEZI
MRRTVGERDVYTARVAYKIAEHLIRLGRSEEAIALDIWSVDPSAHKNEIARTTFLKGKYCVDAFGLKGDNQLRRGNFWALMFFFMALENLVAHAAMVWLSSVVSQQILSCALAMAYGWRLGPLLTFGALPPLVASAYVRMRLEFKLDGDNSLWFANSAGIASEAVRAIRTVASLALEREILTKYEESLRFIAKASVKSLVKHHFWYPLSQSISFLVLAL